MPDIGGYGPKRYRRRPTRSIRRSVLKELKARGKVVPPGTPTRDLYKLY